MAWVSQPDSVGLKDLVATPVELGICFGFQNEVAEQSQALVARLSTD